MRLPPYEPLTKEEEVDLSRRWRERGEVAAYHRLVTSHLRLVHKTVRGYRVAHVSYDDLVQEGYKALLIAVRKYDPDSRLRLSQYALYWIRAAILLAMVQWHGPVRFATTSVRRRLYFVLARTRRALEKQGNVNPTAADMAELLGVRERDVQVVQQRMSGVDVSTDGPVVPGSELRYGDVLRHDGPTPEEEVGDARDRAYTMARVQEAMALLPEREQLIVRERLLQDRPATYNALGTRLGVSRERVRQLQIRAIGVIKEYLRLSGESPGGRVVGLKPPAYATRGAEAA